MNMIQKAKEQVQELTKQAYAAAVKEGLLPEGVTVEPSVEIPKDVSNGDYTTTFCLAESPPGGCRVGAAYDAGGQLLYLCGDRRPRLYELPAG